MNETVKKVLNVVLLVIIFVASVAFNVIGQRHIGAAGLGLQLLGVVGLIFLLWNYNRKYK